MSYLSNWLHNRLTVREADYSIPWRTDWLFERLTNGIYSWIYHIMVAHREGQYMTIIRYLQGSLSYDLRGILPATQHYLNLHQVYPRYV